MDVFDLTATIKLEVDNYLTGLDTAEKKTAGFSKTSSSLLSGLAKVGVAAFGAAEAAIGFFAKSAVSAGMTFDKSMGQVQATMGATAEEIEASVGSVDTSFGHFEGNLREFAQFMGQNTAFSATQAAQALNYMALAGYDTQQSMEMLPNVLNMAAAGGMDLARASDMVTDTQSALGLTAARTSQMVDEFAKAASTGNTNVEQLGEAFLRVGGLARELNGGMVLLSDGTMEEVDNVQELEIAFTAMANAGVKGAEAGTHMRNMIMKLSSPTDKGAEAMEALGVSVFDAEGKMRSLVDIFTDLRAGLDSVSQQEKLEAISEIFNARDLASAEALLSAVDQDWDRIGESILDAQGAAAQMAATQLDNLTGDITLFRSALESAQITISDSLTPALREFVQFGTKGVSELTTAFQEGGLDGAMEKFGELLSEGLSMVVEGLPGAVNAGAKLVGALAKGVSDNILQFVWSVGDIVEILLTQLRDSTQNIGSGIFDFIDKIVGGIVQNYDFISLGAEIIANLITGVANALPNIADTFSEYIDIVIALITDAIPIVVGALSDAIKTLVQSIPKVLSGVKSLVPRIIKAISTLIKSVAEQLPSIISAIVNMLPEVIELIGNTLVDNVDILIDAIADVITMIAQQLPVIMGTIVRVLPTIISKIVQILPRLFVTLVNAIARNLPKIINVIVKMLPQIIIAISKIFVGIVQELPKLIGAIVEALIESGPELLDGFMKALGSLVTAIPKIAAQLWDAAKGIGAAIINGINDFFSDPIGSLEIAADWISEQIFGSGTTFADVKEAFTNWWNAEGPGALSSEQWDDILAGVDLMLTDAGNYLLQDVFGSDTSVEDIKKAFTMWWNDGIGGLSNESWEDILGGVKIMFFDDNPDWFADMIFGANGAALSNVSTAMGQSISDGLLAMQEPANALQEKLNEEGKGWNEFWSEVVGGFGAEDAFSLIGGGTTHFNVRDWIDGSIFDHIKEGFDSFAEDWNTGWDDIFHAIVSAFENWQGAISGIWDLIKQSFPVGEAYDWGVELVESFFNGIMTTLGGFTSMTLGSGIADKVKAMQNNGDSGGTGVFAGTTGTPRNSENTGGSRRIGDEGGNYSGGSKRIESYSASRFSTPEATMSAQRSSFSADAVSIGRMVELLEDIADKDTKISLEGDAAGVFRMVERENKRRTRATRYNSLSMVRS